MNTCDFHKSFLYWRQTDNGWEQEINGKPCVIWCDVWGQWWWSVSGVKLDAGVGAKKIDAQYIAAVYAFDLDVRDGEKIKHI